MATEETTGLHDNPKHTEQTLEAIALMLDAAGTHQRNAPVEFNIDKRKQYGVEKKLSPVEENSNCNGDKN